MPIDVRQIGTCSIVRVEDRFDVPSAATLAQALSQLVADAPVTSIVLDLTDVSPVRPDALVALWAALDVGEIPVAIVSKRLSARRILRRWGGRRLLVFPSVTTAVDALSATPAVEHGHRTGAFRHEALLYDGIEAFLASTTSFISDALADDDPVLVAVSAEKIGLLRERLGSDAARVRFADMEVVGRNPARLIPAWRDFASARSARGHHVRGIGEPIWPGRSDSELVESQHHETLLNLAFADSAAWWLLCPYDTTTLAPDVIDAARRSHPMIMSGTTHTPSADYVHDPADTPFDGPLAPPPETGVAELHFDGTSLRDVARLTARHADRAGLGIGRVRDLARAVSEVAANSVGHGGGSGQVRIWRDGAALVCEVSDAGHLTDPFLGRERPDRDPAAARGLWLANQLCDLVQIRSSAELGTVVRLHVLIG